MRERRLYRCEKGHGVVWEDDPDGHLIAGIRIRMALPDEHNHMTGCVHAPSLGIVNEICTSPMQLIEREELG